MLRPITLNRPKIRTLRPGPYKVYLIDDQCEVSGFNGMLNPVWNATLNTLKLQINDAWWSY